LEAVKLTGAYLSKLERGVSIEDVTVIVKNMMGVQHQKWKCALFIFATYSVNVKRLFIAL